jgi:hypothetical protein
MFLYLVITLSNYINNQFILTLDIIYKSIISLLGTKSTNDLKIHLTIDVFEVSALIAHGEMLSAFAAIKDIYIYIIKSKGLKESEKVANIV